MKKTITIVLIALIPLIVTGVKAKGSPFLVCDPATDATHYEVTLDGQTETVPAYDLGDGTVMLKYDLSGIAMGDHHVSVKAMKLGLFSAPATLDFSLALPGVPVNVRIEG